MATILLVDDDKAVRMLCAAMLSDHACIQAEHGLSGIAHFEQNTIDLVLTDLTMPIMDGVDLIRQIRAQHKTIPIVAMTGTVDGDRSQEALDAGALDVLEKPFGVEQLTLVLSPWL